MKDGRFETQAEIFQALLDGKKVKHVSWDKGEYVFLNTKTLKRENGDDASSSFSMPTNWSIYEEPKKPRKALAFVTDLGGVAWFLEGSEESNHCMATKAWERISGLDLEEKTDSK